MLGLGAAGGWWLYGERFPAVLTRAASGAADRVTDAAVRTSERLDSQEGARIAAEQEARRSAARARRDRELGWVTVSADAPQGPPNNPLAPLRRRGGPAYVSLGAADIGALLAPLLAQLPPSAKTAQLALDGDQLLTRTAVTLTDFAGESALGAVLGKALTGSDTLFLAGPLEPVRPGLAQFRVKELRLRGIEVPTRLIPGLVRSLRAAAMTALDAERPADASVDTVVGARGGTLAADALPLPLPAVVSDVRVVNSRLTLYRAVAPVGTSTPTPSAPTRSVTISPTVTRP